MWMPAIAALLLVVAGVYGQPQSLKKKYQEENLGKMVKLREAHGSIIPMDTEKFKNLVKTKNREYSVVAMFTALKPNFKCEICPGGKQEYSVLTSSYEAAYSDSNDLFFVLIDIHNSQEAFQMMNLKHVPAVFFFPADRKRKKNSDTYDARRLGYKAMGMSQWLYEVSNVKVKIIVPPDFTKLLTAVAVLFPFFILALWKPDFVIKILSNRVLWALLVMTAVMVMTSGQMWNHIRKPPDSSTNSRGKPEYIHGSRGGQFVFESYIVMAINAAISLGFIVLNEAPALKNRKLKKVFGFMGLGMVVIFFALLLSIFRMKNRSYPYMFIFY